jgi:hypothetical protein
MFAKDAASSSIEEQIHFDTVVMPAFKAHVKACIDDVYGPNYGLKRAIEARGWSLFPGTPYRIGPALEFKPVTCRRALMPLRGGVDCPRMHADSAGKNSKPKSMSVVDRKAIARW